MNENIFVSLWVECAHLCKWKVKIFALEQLSSCSRTSIKFVSQFTSAVSLDVILLALSWTVDWALVNLRGSKWTERTFASNVFVSLLCLHTYEDSLKFTFSAKISQIHPFSIALRSFAGDEQTKEDQKIAFFYFLEFSHHVTVVFDQIWILRSPSSLSRTETDSYVLFASVCADSQPWFTCDII